MLPVSEELDQMPIFGLPSLIARLNVLTGSSIFILPQKSRLPPSTPRRDKKALTAASSAVGDQIVCPVSSDGLANP
jgi:hypothetical protein